MNNLTPLQEVAATLMAGMLSGFYADPSVEIVDFKAVRQTALVQAKALLEATKSEPLEWKLLNEKAKTHYSNGGEFCIFEQGGKFKLINELRSNPEESYQVGLFETLDEAKQFAEHIRTR